jgi:hypothetical protein
VAPFLGGLDRNTTEPPRAYRSANCAYIVRIVMKHNELSVYGGRAITEPTTQSPCLERDGHAGSAGSSCRERLRAGQTVPLAGTFDSDPGNAVVMASVTVQGQIFTGRVRGGKLKTWETGNLTSRPATRPSRISGFQVFRISLIPRCTVPGPGGGGNSELRL